MNITSTCYTICKQLEETLYWLHSKRTTDQSATSHRNILAYELQSGSYADVNFCIQQFYSLSDMKNGCKPRQWDGMCPGLRTMPRTLLTKTGPMTNKIIVARNGFPAALNKL